MQKVRTAADLLRVLKEIRTMSEQSGVGQRLRSLRRIYVAADVAIDEFDAANAGKRKPKAKRAKEQPPHMGSGGFRALAGGGE